MARHMPIRPAPILPLAAAALLLAGCTKDQELYPSLSIRDQERVTGVFEPVVAEPYISSPQGAETLGRIERLRTDAKAAHDRFLALAQRVRAPIAAGRGAEMGSEAWSVAEAALADLTGARSETMLPLAELDILYVSAATDGTALAEIEAARGEVEAFVAAQDGLIDSL